MLKHRSLFILFALVICCNTSRAFTNNKKRTVYISFSIATSQNFVNPPFVSGVISDPTDPAATIGIKADITENGLPILATDYTIVATSSKTSVVTVANVTILKFNGYAIVKILPSGVGYSDIKLKLTKGTSTDNITIKYAASAGAATPSATYFHTGCSDASAAIAIDSNYLIIGDDEINSLFVYDRRKSGLPVATYDYQNLLGLTDGSANNYAEIDLEAGVKSPTISNRIYWMSSLGTSGSSNVVKPNINRIFATAFAGTGSATILSTVGHYDNIRNTLINWGNTQNYNFSVSAAAGKDAKTIDGFNVEGMCFAPDNTTLYIGFRAPLVPITNRAHALIAPVLNFETWFNNGTPNGTPSVGSAIELNLGGRGIRDIVRLSNGTYIIVAGNYDNLPLNGAIFRWTGIATDAPVLISQLGISTLNAEAVVEIIENGQMANNKLEIISDDGSTVYYNDGNQAKDLSENNYKKFRTDIISTNQNVLPTKFIFFSTKKKDDNVVLNWQTTNEPNVSHINVQRSLNVKDFTTIGKVNANGASYNEYEFTDNQLPTTYDQLTIYYRILSVDKDGSKTYSEVKQVVMNNKQVAISIFPNPAKDLVTIECAGVKELLVIDYLGKEVYRDKINRNSYIVHLKSFAKGIYIVKAIMNNGTTTTEKLVVE